MREIIVRCGDVIPMGRAGENQVLAVLFDVTGWDESFGSGTFSLAVRRPGEALAYQRDVTREGDQVRWVVSDVDTGSAGTGEVQLRYSVGETLAKSAVYQTVISPSVGDIGPAPDPYEDVLEEIQGYAEDAAASATAAETSRGQAEQRATEAAGSATQAAGSATAAAASAAAARTAAERDVPAAAAAWLEANVDPETGYVLDKSLSIPRTAADAAAVGAVSGAKQITGWSENHLYIKNNDDTITPNSPTSTTSNVRYLITPVIPGEIYTITATGGTASRAYCFADALNNVIERAASSLAMVNVYLIVPENAAYLVVNDTTLTGTVYLGAAPGALAVSDRKDIEAIVTSTGRAAAETLGVEWIVFRRGTYRNALSSWGEKVNIAIPYNDPRFYCAMCECVPGDKITINIKGGSGFNAAWAFLNADRDVIQRTSSPVDGVKQETLTAPQNAAYLVMNCDATYKGFYAYKGSKIDPIATEIDQLKGGAFSWAGKTVAIIGDSISTNGNYGPTNPLGNVPEIVIGDEDIGVQLSAYATYLDVGTTVGGHTITQEEIGTEITFTPTEGDQGKVVGKPDNYNAASTYVWWEVAADKLGFTPIPVSWSGSSITSHEADKDSYKTAHAWHPAQIRKCGIRTPGSMTRTAPDVIIIYRGTNDFSHTPRTKLTLGYFDSNIQGYPTTDYINDSYYGYIEGLMMTVGALRQAYPSAQIVLSTLNVFKRVVYSSFPTRQAQAAGGQTLPMYNNAIRAAADYLGCGLIEFDRDGITFENLYVDGYVTDSASTPTHPSDKGHKVMGNRAIMDLQRLNSLE